jgi:centractin
MGDFKNIFSAIATIIDMGSGKIKAGLSGEEKPSCIFESTIGTAKLEQVLPNKNEIKIVGPGKEVRGLYKIKRPIQRGMLTSCDDANWILKKIYKELKSINNKEIPIFIAEPAFTATKQKKELAELLLENYDTPQIFFGSQAVLSLYSFGKTDGIVLESGEGVTQIAPVYKGYKLNNAIQKINFGGIDVTNKLQGLLRNIGIDLTKEGEDFIVRDIKENLCEIKNQELVDEEENREYQLPDGEVVSLGKERFEAVEINFGKFSNGCNFEGMHNFLYSNLNKLDSDLQKYLYNSIYVSGGNSMTVGFTERLHEELDKILQNQIKINITAVNTDRSLLAWQGASFITNINSFPKLWISKKDWEEEGEQIFNKKYF